MAEKVIQIGHGSGGRMAAELIDELIRPKFDLGELDDAAIISAAGVDLALTTDSFVVNPIFFPGGNIGRLAVFGTVNDLAVQGASPAWLTLAVVAEEGLPVTTFTRVIDSVSAAAREVGVQVVTGDTKVVEKGAVDGLILNTAGVGLRPPGVNLSASRVAAGDIVVISGHVGSHELAVVSRRHNLGFDLVQSDCGSIVEPAGALVEKLGPALKWMRDPTRGGVATVLNELAQAREAVIEVEERAIPVEAAASDAAEILGLDPFYLACEGRLVAIVEEESAAACLDVLRSYPESAGSCAIGRISAVEAGEFQVVLNTLVGSRRILRYLASDQQPRIC